MTYVATSLRFTRYIKNPRAIYYYINKAIRSSAVRVLCFHLVRLIVPKNTVPVDRAELDRLKAQGMLFWPEFIDETMLHQIGGELKNKKVFDVRDAAQTPIDLATINTTETVKLKYFASDLAHCEAVVRIANNEKILALVTNYFGCKPTISIMDVWWTKTGKNLSGQVFQDDMFHRDVEDFKFIKLFIYLTDVAPENGAHCFVKGSHLVSQFTARGPVADEAVAGVFAPEDQLIVTGKARSGFLEDTWGLHRSLPATRGERCVLSITYSLTSLNPQSPDKPVAPNRFGVDPYINRVYLY